MRGTEQAAIYPDALRVDGQRPILVRLLEQSAVVMGQCDEMTRLILDRRRQLRKPAPCAPTLWGTQ